MICGKEKAQQVLASARLRQGERSGERARGEGRRGIADCELGIGMMSEVTKDEEAAVKSIYEGLSRLLDYPGADWNALVTSCAELLAGEKSEVAKSFGSFSDRVQTHSLSDLQELYTRTFDLNPVCAMEIGYHLFGENYKRGVFLANLRATEAPYGLGQEHQLPDYLPVLLRLLTKLDGKDEDLRASLIRECMGPAIEKMI